LVAPRELDPSASVLAYFGSELKRLRTRAGFSQDRLGEIIDHQEGLVGMVEAASRTPSRDFAERCDGALGAEGSLIRLWPLVSRSGLPSWFRGYAELEAKAVEIRSYQAQVVPGLLQTESYARAVLRPARPGNLDQLTAARMERQQILSRPQPPWLWVLLDEAALRRPIGGTEVMCTQLAGLLSFRDSAKVVIQVLPYSAGAHSGLNGSLNLLSFDEGPDVAYSEDYAGGQIRTDPAEVRQCSMRYDLMRAAALSPDDSAELIAQVMEDCDEQQR
jgi:hypothetical protein